MAKTILLSDGEYDTTQGVRTRTLHHLCALRARDCWGLWNQGYPMVRVLDHQPIEEDYKIVVECHPNSIVYFPCNQQFDESIFPVSNPPKLTELVIFLIDLYRLQNRNLIGEFHLLIQNRTINFGEYKYTGRTFMLIPNMRDIREKGRIEKTNMLALAKLAIKIACPHQENSLLSCSSIKSILSKIKGVKFQTKDFPKGKGIMVVDMDGSNMKFWIKKDSTYKRISPKPDGYISLLKEENKNSDDALKIPITFPGGRTEPWANALLCWKREIVCHRNGQRSDLNRNLLGTLCAELHYSGRFNFLYKVVKPLDHETGCITVKIEPRSDEKINARDFFEKGIEEKNMDLEVYPQDKGKDVQREGEKWSMYDIDDKHPFWLIVKPSVNFNSSHHSGRMQPDNIGDQSLQKRKKQLVDNGMVSQIIHTHLEKEKITWWKESKWRLKIRHSLQTLQGPPGTGKTWTATKITKDILQRNPCARILICSKEHLALDHISMKIDEEIKNSGHFVVRVRSSHSDNDYQNDLSLASIGLKIIDELSKSVSTEQKCMLEEKQHEEGKIATWVEELAIRTASVVCMTTLDKVMQRFYDLGESFDFVIVEEAGKCYPSELIGPLSVSMNALLIGDQMQLPPFDIDKIKQSVQSSLKEGREYHENKKGSTTSQYKLVDLSITDRKEKFDDTKVMEISEQINHWLQPFKYLHERKTASDSLNDQWRMFPELSRMIGNIFYNRSFSVKREDFISHDGLPDIFKEHGRLIFIDHNYEEEHTGQSYCNATEAVHAANILKKLREHKYKAVAITPYKGQVQRICKELPKKFHQFVETVDGFQGKESDFVILSMVRSNKKTGRWRRWGFMCDPRRLNVAFSRAREGLVVISSQQHITDTDWDCDDHLKQLLDAISDAGTIVPCENFR